MRAVRRPLSQPDNIEPEFPMCANARRLCLSVAAVAIFAITFPRASEAGTISLDTAFLGSAVGYELESAIPAFQIHAFAIDGLGSVRMSQAAGVDGIGFAEVFEAYCVDILGPIFDNFSPTANPPVEVTAFGDPMTTWSILTGCRFHWVTRQLPRRWPRCTTSSIPSSRAWHRPPPSPSAQSTQRPTSHGPRWP